MQTKLRYSMISLAVALMFIAVLSGCYKKASDTQETGVVEKPTISDAQRALAMLEVQNTMSKHAYYHSIGLNLEELSELWVKEDGEYAKTASFKNMAGIWEGMELIKEYYGTYNLQTRQKDLEAVAKVYPEIKNDPNYSIGGGSWNMHTQTTPIIEIAGDGKTAKGMWYSPGIMQVAVVDKDKVGVSGGWFWEKYGVDFVKEDGKWKIWHIGMYYDNTPPAWGAERAPIVQTGEQAETLQQVKPTRPNPEPYAAWTPTTITTKVEPRFPESYYTFSETFSY